MKNYKKRGQLHQVYLQWENKLKKYAIGFDLSDKYVIIILIYNFFGGIDNG